MPKQKSAQLADVVAVATPTSTHEPEPRAVYLVIHEFFGISIGGGGCTLVTPGGMSEHEHRLQRFRNGQWQAPIALSEATYELQGIFEGAAPLPGRELTPFPSRPSRLLDGGHCRWNLPLPHRIHPLRQVDIRKVRPLFTGADGAEVDGALEAASLVVVFEYVPDGSPIAILEDGKAIELDTETDPDTRTVNFHIWASLGRLQHATDSEGIAHAKHAFSELVKLFPGLDMKPISAVATDDVYAEQRPMPEELGFIELLSLSEIYRVQGSAGEFETDCTPRTCGVAGNLFVVSP